MPLLNDADAVFLGSSAVDKVYLGANEVWPPATGTTYGALVASLGGIHLWNNEETSGSTVADDIGTADATVFGANLNVTLDAALGSAIQYDGVDDYSLHTTLGTFGAGLANSSICFWIKTTTTASRWVLGTFNNGSTTAIQFGINYGNDEAFLPGNHRIYVRDDAGNQRGGGFPFGAMNDGSPHFVGIVLDAGITRAYVDGVERTFTLRSTETATIGTTSNFGFPLAFGARNVRGTLGGFAPVMLDGQAIFPTALTETNFADLYATVVTP